ncbi:branched-chain amino acid aminotransferase [Methylobacterium haplocladii]|uniref:Probable branched-chain-amino-acid aminotransferase n=1 Tax=Methylobacterium haplocladii TaxID=1176176 RepID=A0A512IJE1_9HYPH|nr:branched-chain amino acid aminotransferase [Methylobacterium haplocladii]GEO97819.1 aminotransferase [Methylobacterium haplocladii]GJD82665.1 Branched-chain-amino-acid aminotransferase [Methylobacterium haplocladii]GLS57548.1 aminotransferase [Methylobacterium haplocladii]
MSTPDTDTWTFFEGDWHSGNVRLMGPRTHGAWLGSTVFDGARAFEGVTPDLELHLARVNRSAEALGLKPKVSVEQWDGLVRDGLARFPHDAELYIRPMYWAESGFAGGVRFDPETTNWCLSIYVAPMPLPTGVRATLSPFRRPSIEMAPVDAKAGCLYPNGARALTEALSRGFGNCLMCDGLGNIAEFANANAFFARDGIVYTPVPNGTFLAGITRARVIALLRAEGVAVVEKTLLYDDFLQADEVFTAGNFAKVAPVIGLDDARFEPGPIFRLARKLYWEFAHR